MLLISLDLELNQKVNEQGITVPKIIQVGAVIGDPANGKIVDELDIKINPQELLIPEIVELTAITQAQVDAGTTCLDAYNQLKELKKKHNAHRMFLTWGAGDNDALKKEVPKEAGWVFGFRVLDSKTLAQSYCVANNITMQGGLEKSMTKFGLKFEGRAHDALVDARNTFKIYCFLIEHFKRNKNAIDIR